MKSMSACTIDEYSLEAILKDLIVEVRGSEEYRRAEALLNQEHNLANIVAGR